MKKEDMRWIAGYGVLFITVAALMIDRKFAFFNNRFPYAAGFIQFSVFATSGEILSTRMLYNKWEFNKATAFKSLCWGISGIFVTLAFKIFSEGSAAIMKVDIFPFYGSRMALAFLTSCAINIFFAPVHAAAMRICGNYADMKYKQGQRCTIREAVDSLDWGELIDFTVFKTIPFFWIPVNTIVCMLPLDYRVVCASILSFMFGVLMSVLKLREKKLMKRMEVKNDRSIGQH